MPGVSVLHVTADESHNRSVITFVAPAEAMVDAAFAAVRAARDHIDLSLHAGVHPRIGAADVVPFVPLAGASMQDCIHIARTLGERVGRELEIPVYLYENAATRPDRRNLADVRRGGFELLRDAIRTDAARVPDFGPRRMHPTAGAVAIGARPFLVAFNVYLGVGMMPLARAVARAIRESSGGLRAVKALALEVNSQAQVSMNLVDLEVTPLSAVYAAVEREVAARGGEITWSEIIGLVPERVAFDVAGERLRLRAPLTEHILERRLLEARADTTTLNDYLEAVAVGSGVPGGGSVAAVAGALAASLTRMVANLTLGSPRHAGSNHEMGRISEQAGQLTRTLTDLARRDAEAYAAVMHARKLPSGSPNEAAHRAAVLRSALLGAAAVPLAVARACERVAILALAAAQRGNPNALTDAAAAAALARAGCVSAVLNVRVNVRSLMGFPDAAGATCTTGAARPDLREFQIPELTIPEFEIPQLGVAELAESALALLRATEAAEAQVAEIVELALG